MTHHNNRRQLKTQVLHFMLHFLFPKNNNTQFGLKDLGLIFLKIKNTKLFYSQ